MISEEAQRELKTIADLISSNLINFNTHSKTNDVIINGIVCDALSEAIGSLDVYEASKFIVKNYPSLAFSLSSFLKDKHPDKFSEIEKLLILV